MPEVVIVRVRVRVYKTLDPALPCLALLCIRLSATSPQTPLVACALNFRARDDVMSLGLGDIRKMINQ